MFYFRFVFMRISSLLIGSLSLVYSSTSQDVNFRIIKCPGGSLRVQEGIWLGFQQVKETGDRKLISRYCAAAKAVESGNQSLWPTIGESVNIARRLNEERAFLHCPEGIVEITRSILDAFQQIEIPLGKTNLVSEFCGWLQIGDITQRLHGPHV
jgi:hypothetical protein